MVTDLASATVVLPMNSKRPQLRRAARGVYGRMVRECDGGGIFWKERYA